MRAAPFASLAACITLMLVPAPLGAAAGPNIVLITIDTLRADHLPFYGYAKNTAPFLSELTRRAVVFKRAYSTSSWTAPATASLLTSTYPFQHNVLIGRRAGTKPMQRNGRAVMSCIPKPLTTVAEALRKAGYRTFGVSDNPMVTEQGFGRGFDRFARLGDSGADRVNAQVVSWEELLTQTGAYFLYLHYMDPHEPYRAREPWYVRNQNGDLDRIAAYDSEISFVDRSIEELYRRFAWDKDTIIIITADHGEELNDRGRWGHGYTLFNEVLRVPLLAVLGAGMPSGVIDGPVSLVDVYPTLRALAGLPPSVQERGRSLLAHAAAVGPAGQPTRPAYAHLSSGKEEGNQDGVMRSIALDDWKYITGPAGSALYDLAHDPGERTNVITEHADTANTLRERMLQIEQASPTYDADYYDTNPSEAERERMRVLGY